MHNWLIINTNFAILSYCFVFGSLFMAMASSNLQANSSINLKGMDPKLYFAALSGSFEGVTSISNWMEQVTPTGNSALHIHVGKPLYYKTSKDPEKKVSIGFIEEVLNYDGGHPLLWKENDNGDTPLHLAARFGHKEAVQVFLELVKEVSQEDVTQLLRMANKNKDTALHEAARGCYAALVKLLVEANCNCPHEANEVGETPLYLAAERGCTASVATILDSCHPSALAYNYAGPCSRTPLHAAVLWGDPEMVQKMLEKETLLMRVQDDEGLTPLHCAANEIRKTRILKVLLDFDNKENALSALYIRDNKGRTPLHIAALRHNWKAMKNFTACRPDCKEIVDNHGQQAAHYAAKCGGINLFKAFITREDFLNLHNVKDMDGNTPLHIFAVSTRDFWRGLLLSARSFIRYSEPQAFNKRNLTFGDILASRLHMLDPYNNLPLIRGAPRGRRITTFDKSADIENANSSTESNYRSMRKAAQGQTLVTALIATVSFTAGFTLPGGFDQSSGMAVLKSKAGFKVFLISDAIAFTCSTIALLCYFFIVTSEIKIIYERLSYTASIFNTISLVALMLAFNTGVSVTLSHSPLLVCVLWIAFVLFFLYYCIFLLSLRIAIYHW